MRTIDGASDFYYSLGTDLVVGRSARGNGGSALKSCTNCRGNLADFVTVCPYCGVPQPVQPAQIPQGEWRAPQNSNKAIASLVCGVLLCFGPFANIPAVILGHLSLADIKRSGERMSGKGLAIAGLVLGYFGIVLSTLYIVFVVFAVRGAMGKAIPVNESMAILNLRTYSQALKKYAEKCPQQGYPATLLSLGPGAGDCTRANLIDFRLAGQSPVRQGYKFEYSTGVSGPEKVTAFALVARPVTPGFTGRRFFFLDERGIIRESQSQNVGPNSQAVDGTQVSDNSEETDDLDEDGATEPDPEQVKAIPANEAAAVGSLQMYSSALQKYAEKCPQQVYPATLSPLGPGPGDCNHAGLVSATMVGRKPQHLGYIFDYSTGATGTEKVTVFAFVARPITPGVTGKRYFYLDESGVIRESPNQNIGPNSEPLNKTSR
jgi:hypothetical protein